MIPIRYLCLVAIKIMNKPLIMLMSLLLIVPLMLSFMNKSVIYATILAKPLISTNQKIMSLIDANQKIMSFYAELMLIETNWLSISC